MIAFGCSITEPEPYARYCEPGIRLAAEPNSVVFAFSSVGTIGRSYNLLLDAAASREDLEALVLVHPHTEITDPHLGEKIRSALQDRQVAVLGCAGATGVNSIAWWEGSVTSGQVIHRYTEHGGGDMRGLAWTSVHKPPAEVDTVDGFLLVLSPWAVRELRFDEGLTCGHGFELDICMQARGAGRKVVVVDLPVIQHRSLDVVSDVPLWVEAYVQVAKKWNGRMPGVEEPPGTWRERARRAEAEREAARAITYSRALAAEARVGELQRALEKTTETLSWRLTTPLRVVNKWRRGLAADRTRTLRFGRRVR